MMQGSEGIMIHDPCSSCKRVSEFDGVTSPKTDGCARQWVKQSASVCVRGVAKK